MSLSNHMAYKKGEEVVNISSNPQKVYFQLRSGRVGENAWFTASDLRSARYPASLPVHAKTLTNKLSLLGDNWNTSVRLLFYVLRLLVAVKGRFVGRPTVHENVRYYVTSDSDLFRRHTLVI